MQRNVIAARRVAAKWANGVHQFKEFDVLEDAIIYINGFISEYNKI